MVPGQKAAASIRVKPPTVFAKDPATPHGGGPRSRAGSQMSETNQACAIAGPSSCGFHCKGRAAFAALPEQQPSSQPPGLSSLWIVP